MKKAALFCVSSLVLAFSCISNATGGIESNGPSVNDGALMTAAGNASGEEQSNDESDMLADAGKAIMPLDPVGGIILLMMSKQSSDQADAHKASLVQSTGTADKTDGYNKTTSDGRKEKLSAGTEMRPIRKMLAKLEKAGIYNSKKDTVTIGDKTYKGSDFSSAGSMSSAGLPKGNIDTAMAVAAGVEKKIAEKYKMGSLTAASGFSEGGGGGYGNSASNSSENSAYSYSSGSAGSGKNGLDRDPSSLAGMQKNYNGDPIGVAGDSIFLMMKRRYKAKENQDSFFSDADLALQK